MISSLACFPFCPVCKNWICSTHPCKTQDNLWPELSSPAFAAPSNAFPIHLAHSLESLPSHKRPALTPWSRKNARVCLQRVWVIPSALDYLAAPLLTVPVEKVICAAVCWGGRVGWPLRVWLAVWRLLQAWVLSLTGCLGWPGQVSPSTDQAFIPPSPCSFGS